MQERSPHEGIEVGKGEEIKVEPVGWLAVIVTRNEAYGRGATRQGELPVSEQELDNFR